MKNRQTLHAQGKNAPTANNADRKRIQLAVFPVHRRRSGGALALSCHPDNQIDDPWE